MNRVAVVVLGDIGRSPRMQYHALSISELENTKVSMIGYRESEPHPLIVDNENIDILPLLPFPISMSRSGSKKGLLSLLVLWPLLAVSKVLFQCLQLFYTLWTIPNLSTVLVQSPPAIPTVFILQVVCWLRSVKLIIDWHNLGYTLLALSLGKSDSHPIIIFAKFIERFFGRCAYAHLFVTQEMRDTLVRDWKLKGKTFVFHDKASPIFKNMEPNEQVGYLREFIEKYKIKGQDKAFIESIIETKSSLLMSSKVKHKPDPSVHTSLIISSTSWTPDEDFSILLDAIVKYETDNLQHKQKLLYIITGKGPQKEYYLNRISQLELKKSRVITAWLDSQDYPKLLGCADIGISLHKSSSGLDLPMKVVDMFGCCVPVLAIDFQCIGELVRNEYNGFIFKDSEQLFHQLRSLFGSTSSYADVVETDPKTQQKQSLIQMKQNLIKDRKTDTWDTNWNLVIKNLFLSNNNNNNNDDKKSPSPSSYPKDSKKRK